MRLGGPIFSETDSPESWAQTILASGYKAAYCPLDPKDDTYTIKAYERAACKADIIIAEVGAWSNPLSPDSLEASEALEKCKESLMLAEEIGACCCVNISGSRGPKWDSPDFANLTDETFEMIVSIVRDIIDTVKPTRSFYTLEMMPWMHPDSADDYLRLINAIDRRAFAVHLDPVNIICNPREYFYNGQVIKECFDKLGRYIKSCHAKDIVLRNSFTVHLDEVQPGYGNLDYMTFLKCLNRLDINTPLMLEHLNNEQEYQEASRYIRNIASTQGIEL